MTTGKLKIVHKKIVKKNEKDKIFAACLNCLELLCYQHFVNREDCSDHSDKLPISVQDTPEDFVLEGSIREYVIPKRKRINQQKEKKLLRNSGKGYTQHRSLNLVAPKTMKERCSGTYCNKSGKEFTKFSEENRSSLFNAFNGMGNLLLLREYLVCHVQKEEKKRKITKNESSRRQYTLQYSLPLQGSPVVVCKVFFLNTLGVSEKFLRHPLKK